MSPRRRRERWRGPHGLVCIDKPAGPTSFAVMRQAERLLGAGRAGHGGTLDPAATGVLLVLVGEGTKLSPWVMRWDKTYRAHVRFGVATDSLDAEGTVVEERDVLPGEVTRERVEAALAAFEGEYAQAPPAFSAIKVDGRSLMSRARAGEAVDPEPRMVRCDRLELLGLDGLELEVRLDVGKGYYVRSFARDLGLALGLPAHLSRLRRERVGPFDLGVATDLDALEPSAVIPLERAVPDVPCRRLGAADADAIRHGRPIAAAGPEPEMLLLDAAGEPLAMGGRGDDGRVTVTRGFALHPPGGDTSGGDDSVVDNAESAD
ncbi:MAG: tRNA pseudouridine(55) synthase TruB [Deltaproteobacteria bacterium]|nr:tRNA pseudouridine(55) synthase TruB [Deltaproteobacteria bacterium]MCB9788724.1 tRNA pseudouridine(55) synthase TruB [Deltaproteobacteria bacterium]